MPNNQTFISYCRTDSEEFAIKLANDLRIKGANVWIDKLNIKPGSRWDTEIEKAMYEAECFMVILSPKATSSYNLLDEISYAIDEGKRLIPIISVPCSIPYRLRRFQHIDFSKDYDKGVSDLLSVLELNAKTKQEDSNNLASVKIPTAEKDGSKVLKYAIGIETMGGVFTEIIPAESILPQYFSETFSTATDNQPGVQIHILYGTESLVVKNHSLGVFNLEGISPAPRGVPQIKVNFDIDKNGVLTVTAMDLKTKKHQSVTIT